jgi:hypothetical protein
MNYIDIKKIFLKFLSYIGSLISLMWLFISILGIAMSMTSSNYSYILIDIFISFSVFKNIFKPTTLTLLVEFFISLYCTFYLISLWGLSNTNCQNTTDCMEYSVRYDLEFPTEESIYNIALPYFNMDFFAKLDFFLNTLFSNLFQISVFYLFLILFYFMRILIIKIEK